MLPQSLCYWYFKEWNKKCKRLSYILIHKPGIIHHHIYSFNSWMLAYPRIWCPYRLWGKKKKEHQSLIPEGPCQYANQSEHLKWWLHCIPKKSSFLFYFFLFFTLCWNIPSRNIQSLIGSPSKQCIMNLGLFPTWSYFKCLKKTHVFPQFFFFSSLNVPQFFSFSSCGTFSSLLFSFALDSFPVWHYLF